MFVQKFVWAVLIPVILGPRDQLVSGIIWLHIYKHVRGNNPPNHIWSCFVPPFPAAECRNAAHAVVAGK